MRNVKQEMKEDIVVESTLYSLFIFWLIKGLNKHTIYILDSEIDKGVIKRLETYGRVYLFDSMMKQNPIKKLIYLHIWGKFKLYIYLGNNIKDSQIYGNDHFVGFDLFRKYKYHLLEDGIGNYNLNNTTSIRSTINWIVRGFRHARPYGISDNCTKIYLTGLTSIPDKIQHKTEIINIKKIWSQKTDTEKDQLLEIFNFKRKDLGTLKDKTIYLLTQPLSEDGIITEKEKIDIYKKIISRYNVNDIVLKPHPREKTNYAKYFNNIFILNSPMPFEIFCCINTTIEKVITLFSASALGLDKHIEIEWLGVYEHPKLKKYESKIAYLNPNIKKISK